MKKLVKRFGYFMLGVIVISLLIVVFAGNDESVNTEAASSVDTIADFKSYLEALKKVGADKLHYYLTSKLIEDANKELEAGSISSAIDILDGELGNIQSLKVNLMALNSKIKDSELLKKHKHLVNAMSEYYNVIYYMSRNFHYIKNNNFKKENQVYINSRNEALRKMLDELKPFVDYYEEQVKNNGYEDVLDIIPNYDK